MEITQQQLRAVNCPGSDIINLLPKLNQYVNTLPAEAAWQKISKQLLKSNHNFELHCLIFKTLFPKWPDQLTSAPAWIPGPELIKTTNLYHLMQLNNINNVKEFHTWSMQHYQDFWQKMLEILHINYSDSIVEICDLSQGIESPIWLKGASLNITNSCFNASSGKIALIYQDSKAKINTMSYLELNHLSNQIANSLVKLGLNPDDAIAIDMPMNHLAVAIYLGIIKMGGIIVSIADSFSADEIATRLRIADTKAIFTQDYLLRNGKTLPLYEKVISANSPQAIVLSCVDNMDLPLREQDITWENFLVSNNQFIPILKSPMSACNILFSSGTTGIPKAIPWNHTTAIKAATDGYLHLNIQPDDIIAWPTNLGWMMGPWLIFAGLINQATIALYSDVPQTHSFGEFIQDAKVTILGVVPSLVAHWRQSHCMENLNWNAIKLFTSTGECSNPHDMFYLMFLAGYKPVIEYCGGTEIGGAYISSTVCENNYPSVFTTPTMGLNFTLLDQTGSEASQGEVALMPPSIGLSTELLNADHHKIYYAGMPQSSKQQILRRHGDQFQQLENGYYSALGRIDDTMNLGGIKISSAEIERTLVGIPDIIESAAIAINNEAHGPSKLVIYAAIGNKDNVDKDLMIQIMQMRINQHLNPLFKIYDLIFIPSLPKTASNKIMRRILRSEYSNLKNNML